LPRIKQHKMNTEKLSIATITWARDEKEETLLRTSLQQLASFNLPVFITDGGSGASFLAFLQSFPHFRLLQAKAKGAWAQARNSLSEAHASGSEFILYTEPDKYHFFNEFLSTMLSKAETNDQTGVILASRSGSGFATFPAFQQMTETTINNCCAEVIGKQIDYTYGPFLLNRKLVPYLKLIQEDIGWGWRPFTFAIAKRLGYMVDAFIADLPCPQDQQEDNAAERIYRMKQLHQNIQGIVLSATVKLEEV